MSVNMGLADRLIRAFVGVVLIALPFLSQAAIFDGILLWLSLGVGVIMLVTSATGFCPLYKPFGIKTCRS